MKLTKKGFTLAELLIVVAIIAVLVAVSIPIFTAKLENTKATVCKSNREALKHHIVADYLSGDIESVNTSKLKEYIKQDDAKCPSGSTLYPSGSLGTNFTVKCRYHNDGIKPGDEANSIGSIVTSIGDTISEFLKGSNETGNTSILKEFFSKEENRKIVKDAFVSDVLSEKQAEKLAEAIGGDNKDKILASINRYRDSEDMKLVPYVVGATGETLVYYTTGEEYNKRFSGNGASYHSSTSLVSYNNKWYFYNSTNYDHSSIAQGYGPADFNKCKNASEIQERLNDTSKWIPLD